MYMIISLTYEEYGRESSCDVHVMRSPGEAGAKLPGNKESHNSNTGIKADVEEGSKEYKE